MSAHLHEQRLKGVEMPAVPDLETVMRNSVGGGTLRDTNSSGFLGEVISKSSSSGSGSTGSSDGLVNTGAYAAKYGVWSSLTQGNLNADNFSSYGGAINLQTNLNKNIFTSSDTWTSTYGNAAAPIVSEASDWTLDGVDIVEAGLLTSTLSIGTLVVTLEDDVTDFDIVVSGEITGVISPTATIIGEDLQSFTIDVV